jgi:DNA-binding CsgD family transcriptional regulator
MLELMNRAEAPLHSLPAAAEPPSTSTLLARTLDEVDFGIALLRADGEVLHLNHRARRTLHGDGPLQVQGNRLVSHEPCTLARLNHALHDAAHRGLRRLLSIGPDSARLLAALVPVQTGIAALLLGRTEVCEDLSIQCFARQHELTAAETRVFAALGRGVVPSEIARDQGVKLSTVRTQIASVRQKTGTPSIAALVRLAAGLPPMVSALRV